MLVSKDFHMAPDWQVTLLIKANYMFENACYLAVWTLNYPKRTDIDTRMSILSNISFDNYPNLQRNNFALESGADACMYQNVLWI